MTRHIAGWVLPLLFVLGLGPGAAQAILAVPATLSVFDFSGKCSDCQGTGNAELTLANYTLGTAITSTNFVSVHYDGTNLFSAFTISSGSTGFSAQGVVNAPFPESERVLAFGDGYAFKTFTNGTWCVGTAATCASDMGSTSSWTPAPAAIATGAVPEPLSVALLAGGLLAGFVVRRKRG